MVGGTPPLAYGTLIVNPPSVAAQSNKTVNFTANQSQTVVNGTGYGTYLAGGGPGGIPSNGDVNTYGNNGLDGNLTALNPTTVGVTGLYGGPYGAGAGGENVKGSPGAVIIRWS